MNDKTMGKLYFSKEIAKDLKIDEAIFLHHICHWVIFNELNGNEKNYEEGKYWTYNSDKKMSEVFGFFTPAVIRRIRNNLLKEGYIETGCFNSMIQDKTTWYTFTEKVEEVAEDGYLKSIYEYIHAKNDSFV